MFVPVCFEPANLEELVEYVLVARQITRLQREHLMYVFLKGALKQSEIVLLDRVLHSIRKGILQLVE